MNDDVREAMRDWLDSQNWNVFFTGTFRWRLSPSQCEMMCTRWHDRAVSMEHDRGRAMRYAWYIEGQRQQPDNFLFDADRARGQGRLVTPIRGHVHSVFQIDPLPESMMEGARKRGYVAPQWRDWARHYGRAKMERIEGDGLVRYVTKYVSKNTALWGIGGDYE